MATSWACGIGRQRIDGRAEPRLPQPMSPTFSVSSVPAWANRGTDSAASAVEAAADCFRKSRRLRESELLAMNFVPELRARNWQRNLDISISAG